MLSLRTQYPFLGALTSFAETNKKDTTVFRSHSTASDTLMKQYKVIKTILHIVCYLKELFK